MALSFEKYCAMHFEYELYQIGRTQYNPTDKHSLMVIDIREQMTSTTNKATNIAVHRNEPGWSRSRGEFVASHEWRDFSSFQALLWTKHSLDLR